MRTRVRSHWSRLISPRDKCYKGSNIQEFSLGGHTSQGYIVNASFCMGVFNLYVLQWNRLTLCIRQSDNGPIHTSATPLNGEDKYDLSFMPLRFSLATCMDPDPCDTVRHCSPCGSTTRDRVPTRHNLFLLTALQTPENRRAVSIRLNPLRGTVSQAF
jgi:hypothetical protein